MESELLDVASNSEIQSILSLVDNVISRRANFSDIMGLGTSQIAHNRGSITVKVRPQFFGHLSGVVAQEVYGDQKIGLEPRQILEIIRDFEPNNIVELQSAVYELEDVSSPPEKRLSAGRRLQTFLGRLGSKVGDKIIDASISALQVYIQGKLGI